MVATDDTAALCGRGTCPPTHSAYVKSEVVYVGTGR